MTKIIDLLPHNLRKDTFIVALAEAFEIEMKKLYDEFLLYANLSKLENLPEVMVDFLAFEKHTDFYEDLTLDEKRNVVRKSMEIHRKKGTKYALQRVFELLNLRAEITEWFEYGGETYHFKIDILEVSEKGITDNLVGLLDRLIKTYKNNRSWLESLTVFLTSRGKFYTAAIGLYGEEIVIFPYSVKSIEVKGNYNSGMAQAELDSTIIYPRGGSIGE